MARYPVIKLGAVRELWKQQRYSPPEALRRQVESIEQMTGELDPSATYPMEWVIFRVTGYRPDIDGAVSDSVPGAALIADLPALAERLCAGAGFTWEECVKAGAIGMDALATKWDISRKTVERQRSRGLVARRVAGPTGRPRLVYMPFVLRRHEDRFKNELGEAAGFSRISVRDEERIIRRATRYRRVLGCSAHQAAERLAPKFGRSVEAVRLLISRAGGKFAGRSRLGESDRSTAWEMWRQGEDVGAIAARLGRTRAEARRAVHVERARRLRTLAAEGALGTQPSPDDAGLARLLATEPVRTGLGRDGETDLHAFLENARRWHVPVAYEERARAAAYQGIRAWVRGAAARLDAHNPGVAEIDRMETYLRFALRLKIELMRSQLPVMMQTVENVLGGDVMGVAGMTTQRVRVIIAEALAVVGDAVDSFLPAPAGRGGRSEGVSGRLAAPVTLGVTRVVTRVAAGSAAAAAGSVRRAQSRLVPGTTVEDWTRRVSPWQTWLDWPGAQRDIGTASELEREVVAMRYGWKGTPPMTLHEVAASLHITERRATEIERAAIRQATESTREERAD